MRDAVKAMGFGLMVLIPLLGPLGYALQMPWLSPAVVFGLVPLLDAAVGEDLTNVDDRHDRWSWYYWLVPHAYVATWLGAGAWTVHRIVAGVDLGTGVGLFVALGIASGFATCAAHELLHRGRSFDVWISRLTMAFVAYGHFIVEHLHHHSTVGRYECGTVPAPGESMWAFVARNAVGSYANAYRVAERIRLAKGQSWFANRVVQQHLLSAALLAAGFVTWGWAGAALLVAQAAAAIFTVELVQYCEHYGLTRHDGERAGVRLSWNTNGWLTNSLTLNITRHSDHHLDASVPYQSLRALPGAPYMPMGYFGMTWLAVVPWVWRRFVDPLRARHGTRQDPAPSVMPASMSD